MLRPIVLLALPCALLLGACGGGATTPPAPPARTDFAQPTQIVGKISDYNKLNGTLEILGKNKQVLSSATMKTTGDFTIDLPNATGATKLNEATFQYLAQGVQKNGEGCTGKGILSNPAAQVYILGFLQLVQGNTKNPLASNTLSIFKDVVIGNISIWLYASSAVSLTGEKNCGGKLRTTNIQLKSGWNQTFLSIAADASSSWQSVDPASTSWGEPTQMVLFLSVPE